MGHLISTQMLGIFVHCFTQISGELVNHITDYLNMLFSWLCKAKKANLQLMKRLCLSI